MAIFPTTTPTVGSDNTDFLLFSDTSDSDNLKKNTPSNIVGAGLPGNTTDMLPAGAINLYMTPGEKVKLAGVQTGAQVNSVDSVNGQTGTVLLDQDDIPDGSTYVRTENNFTAVKVAELNAATNHLSDLNNPHQTTPANIGIGNVTNDVQLSTTAGNFSSLVEKSDIQQHLDDLFVVQDSDDLNIIKKVTNKTDLIWKASLCQVWGTSINYYRFNFVSSTTYDIRSIVVFGGNLYLCTVNHQSSGSFAADLALGYWTLIGTGGMPGGVSVTTGAGVPVLVGTSVGDLYIDNVNNQLYIWDGATWNLYVSPLVFPVTAGSPAVAGTIVGEGRFDPANGNIYIWDGAVWVANTSGSTGTISYLTTPVSIGNRLVFSIGVNADTIDESVISYTALPVPTIDMGGVTTTGIQNFDNNYISNYDGSTMNYTQITQNFTDTPNQISCEVTPLFATNFTAPVATQWVEIKVDYDNTVDAVVSKTIISLFNGNTQSIVFNTATTSGTVEVSWAAGDATLNITSGNAAFFSFDLVEAWCWYNGVSVNNYQNKIHIHNGDITENINTYESNVGVTQVYDNTSTFINNGTTVLNTVNVTSLTVNGVIVPTASNLVVDENVTYVAGEAITAGEHLYRDNTITQPTDSGVILNLPGTGSVGNFGTAFVNTTARKIISTIIYTEGWRTGGGTNEYTLTGNLYAASGTPGAGAIATGPSLDTPAPLSVTLSSTIGFNAMTFEHLWDSPTLSVGNYVIQFSVNTIGLNSDFNVKGISSAFPDTNFLENNVASNSEAMKVVILFDNGDKVILSDSSLPLYYTYAGVATNTAAIGANVTTKVRGLVSETGATNSSQAWYASTTPGVLSTTPDTDLTFVGRGYSTGIIQIRGVADLNLPTFDVANASFVAPSVTQYKYFFLTGGAFIDFSYRQTGGSGGSTLNYETSIDSVNWKSIGRDDIDIAIGDTNINKSFTITGSKYFRFRWFGGGAQIAIENIEVLAF